MAAVTQRGVQADLPGCDLQKLEDFLYADRKMHAGRGVALLNDFGYRIGVLLRLQFRVLVFKTLRGGAFIAHASLMLGLLLRCLIWLHLLPSVMQCSGPAKDRARS